MASQKDRHGQQLAAHHVRVQLSIALRPIVDVLVEGVLFSLHLHNWLLMGVEVSTTDDTELGRAGGTGGRSGLWHTRCLLE